MFRKKMFLLSLLCVLPLVFTANAAVAARFLGINYGPYHHGESPGTAITDAQFLADLQTMATKLPQYSYIRTYEVSTASRMDQLVPLAAANFPNFKFAIGVEVTTDAAKTQAQMQTAWNLANTYNNVYAIVVGNECTPSDTFNPNRVADIQTLIGYINTVKSNLTNSNVKVTTGMSYGGANDYGNAVLNSVDIMMVHVYPFYAGPGMAGVDINNAMTNLFDPSYGFTSFVNRFAPKEVVLGETGWPSAPTGSPYGASVPSAQNQYVYTTNLTAQLTNRNYSGFVFEAFDEAWKTSENVWGPHWGLLNADGTSKGRFGIGGSASLPASLPLLLNDN